MRQFFKKKLRTSHAPVLAEAQPAHELPIKIQTTGDNRLCNETVPRFKQAYADNTLVSTHLLLDGRKCRVFLKGLVLEGTKFSYRRMNWGQNYYGGSAAYIPDTGLFYKVTVNPDGSISLRKAVNIDNDLKSNYSAPKNIRKLFSEKKPLTKRLADHVRTIFKPRSTNSEGTI
ncbi:MAG: hypothetical protein NUV57_03885 [archaeon]|nr:hypothetical protein [archaeon]